MKDWYKPITTKPIWMRNLEVYKYLCPEKPVRELEANYIEAIEGIMEILKPVWKLTIPMQSKYRQEYKEHFYSLYAHQLSIIEKAYGHSWEEIGE